jgi:hypothetical protein
MFLNENKGMKNINFSINRIVVILIMLFFVLISSGCCVFRGLAEMGFMGAGWKSSDSETPIESNNLIEDNSK